MIRDEAAGINVGILGGVTGIRQKVAQGKRESLVIGVLCIGAIDDKLLNEL